MESMLKPPKAVLLARESQKGMHWALEILVFIAVFLVCTIGEVMLSLPFQTFFLMQDSNYLDAIASGDVKRAEEAAYLAVNSDLFTIFSLFATGIMIFLVLLFCRLFQKRRLSTLGFEKERCGLSYVKGIFIGFLMFSAAVGICMLTGSIKLSGSGGSFVLSSFLLFAAGYMVQGMAEEVLCRGYFMVSFGRRYSMGAAVFINAAAFAALHLLNPGIGLLPILNLFLFGIFASVCFIKTENIWLIGALHSVWNLVQGNVYGIKVSGMETSCTVFSASLTGGREIFHGGSFGLEGGLAVTIVLLAGIAVLLFQLNKNKKDLAVENYETGITEH